MKVLTSCYIRNIDLVDINRTVDGVVLSLCIGDKTIDITRKVYYTRKGAYINVFGERLYMQQLKKADV